ncbi:VaFE repeat-containing surface-anchored protein [Robinsoniella peoriensis]
MKKILKKTVAFVSAAAVILSTCGNYVQAAPAERDTGKQSFHVFLEVCEHGTLALDKQDGTYEKGEVAEVTAVPEKGYCLAEIKVTIKDEAEDTEVPLKKTEEGITFEIPDRDVMVHASFAAKEKETEAKTEKAAETKKETETAVETKAETETTVETKVETEMKTETAPNISGLKSLGNGTDTRTTNTVTIQVENNRLDWFKASGTGWFSQTKPQIVLYNNEAAFGDGMVNKSSYCLYSSKHSPEGNYHPGGGQFLSAAINYVLYYGNRAYGETMHDPKYSAGEYYKDYYITSMAIHYLNGEMGNEPMFQITDEHISSLGDPVAADMYQKYKLLIADAKKAAADGHDVLDTAGRVSNAKYSIEGDTTQNAWKVDTENGGYRTKNNYKVKVSDMYAFDNIKGVKPVNAATGSTEPGTSIKFVNDKINSAFYIHVTEAAYQRMQKNQTKLKAVITGTTHTFSGTRYDPENAASISGDPLQPVTFLEWDTKKTDVKLATVYAEPPKLENGKAKIKKVSANPSISNGNSCYSLEGAEFKLTNAKTGIEVAERLVTKANGESQEITLPAGDYTMEETKAPKGFKLSTEKFSVKVISGKTTIREIENEPVNDPVGVLLKKIDQETRKPAATGAGTFENAEYTFHYYDGLYKTEAELNGVIPTRTWVIATDVDGQIWLKTARKVSGDEFYLNTEGQRAFPLGTVTIQETKAPSGYQLDPTLYIQNIEADFKGAIINSPQAPNSPEPSIRGGVQIEKHDLELNDKTQQGDATLAEAIFDIYNRSINPVTVNGTMFQKDEVVYTFKTDSSGIAKTAADLLQYGDYEIIEREAPSGYRNTGKIQQSFQIREHGKIVELAGETAIKNEPIRGGVQIEKWDNETNEGKVQGNATLEGTVIQIVNKSNMPVLVEGNLYQPEEVVKTVETNQDGKYSSANDLLPYGTYEAVEVSPPAGYLPTGKLKETFEIRKDREIVVLTGDRAIKNEPVRGDLKGIKVSDGDLKRMAGVPYKITSVTTGENHIVVTDENGMFSTASDWVPHSQNTNRGETAEDGIWFGSIEALDDAKGALLYDTYRIEELPCEANEDKVLLKPFEVVVKKNLVVIDLGTITNDYKPKPEIGTTAKDQSSGSNTGYIRKKTTLTDTVEYVNLTPGVEKLLKGVLMDPETGKPFLDNNKEVWAEKTFTPEKASGTVEITFTFDSSALAGKKVVVFEYLYEQGKEIAVHTDLKDKGQTVSYQAPEIGTKAADMETSSNMGYTSEKTTIVDTVSYRNLIPGKEHLVKGVLMDQETKKPLLVDGKEIRAEKTFTPEKPNGSIELTFTFDSSALAGKKVVVFEYLYEQEREIATHTDITDKNQTVAYQAPEVRTTAKDQESGTHTGQISKTTTLVDTIAYKGLIPGKEHHVKGVVMDKKTKKPLLVDGKEIRAEKTFTPDKASGTVEITFSFDSSALAGKEVVVFESVYYLDREIAVHADITDKNQTVKYEKPKNVTVDFEIAKLADRTTGAAFNEKTGRYEGTKTPGTYQPGDKVSWKILVTNIGNMTIKDLEVEDTLSQALAASLDNVAFACTDGAVLKTVDGREVIIKVENSLKVVLDHIAPKDRIELTVKGTLKKTVPVYDTNLENKVTGKAGDLSKTDKDAIKIPKSGEKGSTSTSAGTTPPKTGDETPIAFYVSLAGAALAAIGFIVKKRKKKAVRH